MKSQTIYHAIVNKSVLSFYYKDCYRVVEPHCYGITTAGNEALRCYQTSGRCNQGKVPDWKMMLVDEIARLDVTGDNFSDPRRGYRKDDKTDVANFC